MLLSPFVAVLTLYGALAQPHPGRCQITNELPPPAGENCYWTVQEDPRKCRIYVELCGEPPINCTASNEILWNCSTLCEPTCAQRWPGCDTECGPPKCQCAFGHARNEEGDCVKLYECLLRADTIKRCARNEVFKTCSSNCEPTCTSNPNQPCSLNCGPPKCQCREGYVRRGRDCILRQNCFANDVPRCGANEEYSMCGRMCEPTCTTAQSPCSGTCGPPMCKCRNGFVRSSWGACIRRQQCPAYPQDPPRKCGRNEQFLTCSSMCSPTCSTPPSQPCPRGCGPPRCQCLDGFVRDARMMCIPRNQCPASDFPSCGRNEELVTCSSRCEPTCTSKPNEPCVLACGPTKCQCKTGFVRSSSGQCIARSQCPPSPTSYPPIHCGVNEEFRMCSSMCESSCKTSPNELCPLGCGPPSCQCIDGFARDSKKKCIPKYQCPAQDASLACDRNEELVSCSGCEQQCFSPPNQPCTAMCGPPKCQCRKGLLRDPRGYCVLPQQCFRIMPRSEECGENELFAECSSRCEPTCLNRSSACTMDCGPPKCQCAYGFFRTPQGICVPAEKCPPIGPLPLVTRCGEREVYRVCSSQCEPSCEDPRPKCSILCGPPSCQCRRTFLRSSDGKCIRRHLCPPNVKL